MRASGRRSQRKPPPSNPLPILHSKAGSMAFPLTQELLCPAMAAALHFLQQQGVTAYLVGGWVRDLVLGQPSKDLDLVVAGDAFALARLLAERFHGAFVPLHDAPDIARVVVKDEAGPWTLDLVALQGTPAQDLARRDFTIDALALPVEHLAKPWSLDDVIDPFGGLGDLQEQVVKVTGGQVFRDDPVRLLRAVRLAAQLSFQIEDNTVKLIERDASLLEGVSSERVRDELLHTLAVEGAPHHLRLMDRVGLLGHLLPELELGRNVQQPQEHYWDVFHHNLETTGMVERLLDREEAAQDEALALVPWPVFLDDHLASEVCDGYSRTVYLKLAGLLHDLGKPATRTIEPSGRIRFLGHHEVGATLAAEALRRLRVGGRGVQLVEAMVRHHLRPGQLSQPGAPPTRRAVYRYYRDLGESAVDTLYLNLADYLAARGPMLELEGWRARCEAVAAVLAGWEENKGPKRLLDGHDLMEALHLPPGPLIGRLLDVAEEAQAVGEVTTREEALAVARKTLPTEVGMANNGAPPAEIEAPQEDREEVDS